MFTNLSMRKLALAGSCASVLAVVAFTPADAASDRSSPNDRTRPSGANPGDPPQVAKKVPGPVVAAPIAAFGGGSGGGFQAACPTYHLIYDRLGSPVSREIDDACK